MKSLLTTLFALSLAACADYGNLGRERAGDLASPTAPASSSAPHPPCAIVPLIRALS